MAVSRLKLLSVFLTTLREVEVLSPSHDLCNWITIAIQERYAHVEGQCL